MVAVLAMLVAGTACSSSSPQPAPAKPQNPLAVSATDAAEITRPEPTTADLMNDATHADVIVVADVVALGPAPGPPAEPCRQQDATYRVTESLRGAATGDELRVTHSICLGRPWVDNRTVGLSAAHFQPGKSFVLFLQRAADGYVAFDERFGVLANDEATLAAVAKAVKSAGARPGGGGDPFSGRRR